MVSGWNLLTNDAVAKRKIREIRAGVTEDGDPLQVEIAFCDHLYEPRNLGVDVEERCPEGVICLNISILAVPSGLHLPPLDVAQTKFRPTGEMVDSIPEVLEVPNLFTAEAAKAMQGPAKPSKVEAGPDRVVDHESNTREDEVFSPNVTAAEIATARAEAQAMRKGGGPVPFKRFGLTHQEIMEMLRDPP